MLFQLGQLLKAGASRKLPSLEMDILGVTSISILSEILPSRKPPKTWGNGWLLKRTMAEQNGDQPLETWVLRAPKEDVVFKPVA